MMAFMLGEVVSELRNAIFTVAMKVSHGRFKHREVPSLSGHSNKANLRRGLALVIHAYNLDSFKSQLTELSGSTGFSEIKSIFVTTNASQTLPVSGILTELGIEAEVRAFPNVGRDILPFLELAKAGLLEGFTVLKVHSKQDSSINRGWISNREIADKLLSASAVCMIHNLQAQEIDFIATISRNIYGKSHWGSNVCKTIRIVNALPIQPKLPVFEFPGGSVYWASEGVVAVLAQIPVEKLHFRVEPIRGDGETAHAIERVVGIVANSIGCGVVAMDKFEISG